MNKNCGDRDAAPQLQTLRSSTYTQMQLFMEIHFAQNSFAVPGVGHWNCVSELTDFGRGIEMQSGTKISHVSNPFLQPGQPG